MFIIGLNRFKIEFYFIKNASPNIAVILPVTTNNNSQIKNEIESTEVMLLIIVKPRYVNTNASAILDIILETTADSSLAWNDKL